MDLGKAFSFVFDDDQWATSILIGGLISIIPVVGWFAIWGYLLETARNVAAGSPRPLPQWNNFGEKLTLGLYYFVISLVYAIPLVIVILLLLCFPVMLVIGAGAYGDASSSIAGLLLCLFPLLAIVVLILAILWSLLLLAALVRYLQTGSLGAALQVGEVIPMLRGNLGMWFVLWLVELLCAFIAGLGSAVIFGVIFTVPYSQAVFGHCLGQTLRRFSPPAAYGPTTAL